MVNITEIWKNPKFSMSAMVRRMAEREAEKVIEMARQKPAEQIAEALIRADGIHREVVTELDRLMDLTDEDLFGGAA